MNEIHYQLPDHVRRIIDREGETEFTPPSFERWLGRLQMLRTLASMGAFMLVSLAAYGAGMGWESSTIRGIVAALVFHFFAWAVGLFIFGELYDLEVKRARVALEERERERARRIEQYYRDRLRAQGILDDAPDQETSLASAIGGYDENAGGTVSSMPSISEPQRYAA